MNCAYHTHNAANVNCNGCGKSLCPACDHRIKGFPYCQDCIVQGVQLLRNQNQGSYSQFVQSQSSPFAAFLLSFCPGLGAAYNGQTVKALVHFGVSVGLLQLMLQTGMAIFFFGFLGMWVYAAVDAWKTARMIRRGVVPETAETMLAQRFSGSLKVWAGVLIGIGLLFFLDARFLVRGLLPIMLIGLGVYILRAYFFSSERIPKYESQSDPGLIAAVSDYRSDRFESRYDSSPSGAEAKSWRNR
ncbi:MAG: B-box zinc finger protein [Acidobacteria bacterium]|nr:B-box zinc finger protein [Acidobacteriota bacterium]MBK8809336.1 B-box zinc finger protein [Acidobacteriota bacterium]